MRVNNARMLAVLALGLSGDPAGAGPEGTDMHLEDSGFVMRPADSDEKLGQLRLLPPRQFVGRMKAGRRYFVYADPDYCKCVFVGDQRAMDAYRSIASQRLQQPDVVGPSGVSPENQVIRDMDPGVSDLINDGNILDLRFE